MQKVKEAFTTLVRRQLADLEKGVSDLYSTIADPENQRCRSKAGAKTPLQNKQLNDIIAINLNELLCMGDGRIRGHYKVYAVKYQQATTLIQTTSFILLECHKKYSSYQILTK